MLWERLQIPEEERVASAVHVAGSRAKTIKAVRTILYFRVGGWGAAAPYLTFLNGGDFSSSWVQGK